MSDVNNYGKPPPTAPSPDSVVYSTGNAQSAPPQYGFQPPPQFEPPVYPQYPPPYTQNYQSTYAPPIQPTVQPTPVSQQTVIVMGGCPSCRVGVLEDDYTCCGILCAICFFPIGILCCLAMKEKRCTKCNATF